MKKSATFLILFLILFSTLLVIATNDGTTISNEDEYNSTKIEEGFTCLEEKAGDCSSLTTQELALTIMATPDNIFDDCVKELESRESSDNWGNIRDTALSVIALRHAGKDTEASVKWLLKQNQTPTKLIWYLQEDSNEAVQCNIGYGSNDYTININENKKIDQSAGFCLVPAQSNFWLQISNNCYDEKFQIGCNKDFIANLIYRNKDSPTIYVLEGTSSAPAFGSVELTVKSKCFGNNGCDYEATAWTALALLETGNNVDEYIPYIIAMSETNEQYLPSSFVYILTNYEDYASSLISEQKLGNYWQSPSSAYDRYYDTSLALLTLSSSTAEQITKAKDWLLFSQGQNGCWQNSIRDTAMALWALEGKAGKSESSSKGVSTVTYCSEAGYFCIPSTECETSENVGDNYFCSSLSDTCCMTQNLKSCSEYAGEKCGSNEICTGNSRKATDTDKCCTGYCEEKTTENECEANFYSCSKSCSDTQEAIPAYSCDMGDVCCKTKNPESHPAGSAWWIWVLIILILMILGAIAYMYREQLKLYWFQLKSKFKKEKGSGSSGSLPPSRPGIPPRPGFPPIRRPIVPMRPNQRSPVPKHPRRTPVSRRDRAMSDTFRKLQEMSK